MATFSELVDTNELWGVLDSTKLQEYQTCERAYFFRYVLGWRVIETSNIHLEFGTAVHLGMEVLATDGYTAEACAKAFEVFYEHYRKHFPPEYDDGNAPKTPANFLRALPQYCAKYKNADKDDEILHVETAGVVHISVDRVLHFKMDTIYKGPDGYASREHKTGSRFSSTWEANWRQKIQAGTYNHVLYSLYPQIEVFGVVINGMFLHNEPKTTKDGRPYANAKDNEFHRVPVRMTPEQMEGWRHDVMRLVDNVEEDHEKLAETAEGDLIMDAFPRNRESCTKYNRPCPYLNVCSTVQNPVRLLAQPVPVAFEKEEWDPRNIPTVKEKLEL
jgi:hypothetical protein